MSKGIAHIQRFIEQILSTEADELDCLGVLGTIERYVDLHTAGIDPSKLLPGLPLHFKHCPDCADMYAVLMDLARMEASNLLPDVDALWRELEAITLPPAAVAPAAALAASEAAPIGPPALDAAAATAGSPAAASSGAGPLQRWLRRFFFAPAAGSAARADLTGRPSARPAPGWGALALASVVALGLGLGWWQAEQRERATQGRFRAMQAMLLDHARQEIGDDPEMAAILSEVDRVTVGRGEDGAWVRVFYRPGYDRALVFLGQMPKMARGQRLEGWLVKAGSPARSTGEMSHDTLRAADDYWAIPCRGPLGEDTIFMLTIEPEHDPVVSVALGGP